MTARARVAANDDGRLMAAGVVLPRRGLRREDAALYIGVSATKFDAMVAVGDMPKPRHFGGCRVWDIRELDAAFDGADDGGPNPWD